MQIGLPSSFQINEDLTVLNFQTEQDILGIGSKLNSAYLFREQEKKTKPSAPTKSFEIVIFSLQAPCRSLPI
jgi:hypothetical protein